VSFILDALRKSEHARQSLGNASIAELPLGRRTRSQPWWIFAIAALLLINLAVLTVVLLRDRSPAMQKAAPQSNVFTAPPSRSESSNRAPLFQASAETRPLAEEASPPQVSYETVDRNDTPLASTASDGPALVKRIDESSRVGSVTTAPPGEVPDLHIDMHVYAKQPADRFVFINMHKYTEGQTLAEGPRLDEITPDGVVLFYKGQQLRLQRQ
jgi:general secretion pathway protein B